MILQSPKGIFYTRLVPNKDMGTFLLLLIIVVVATADKKPSWMKRGKAKREHNPRRKCYILGKFYTSTPNVVNAENLIHLNSCED